jgi:hypothetical protein
MKLGYFKNKIRLKLFKMKSKIVEEILKNTSLETRLKVHLEMMVNIQVILMKNFNIY